ncbi:terminase small subunit [Mucilaginibacter psychrotolerans]|uniref:Uncharacterized protein n=1 Tax=Mucilaginibacter psychrotolerans TaxID=1524096 RepID=A0A4Y8S3S0_9SPHI|nr:terminase small subunit [Mucilaginibacter psychrotolerans]TFF32184.1 hypothetical protein E2R66_27035 [Mucilaginibacter psychrotolerans]
MTYFYTAAELSDRIERYFLSVKGAPEPEKRPQLKNRKKESPNVIRITTDDKTDPPLLTGLALFLGFKSLDEFEAYEQKGVYKKILQEARLRIACEYEKKLHKPSPTGAIFALKCMGWHEKHEAKSANNTSVNVCVNIQDSGPKLAEKEKDVAL